MDPQNSTSKLQPKEDAMKGKTSAAIMLGLFALQ